MARQKFTICIHSLFILYASLGSATKLSLLESQFLTINEGTTLTLQSGSQEKVHIVKAHEKPWYKEFYTTEPEGAGMLWHKFNHAREIITQDFEHVFEKVRLPFEFQLYGQLIKEVIISSAGALLTGDPEDEILIPSHIAPFLAHLTPSKDDEVYYVSDEKFFLVQWSKDIDGTYKNRFEFQTQLSPDGGVVFVYRHFSDQVRNAALKSGYPVLIGLQDSFAVKREKAKDGLTVYAYPSLLMPLDSFFKTSDYSAIVFQPKSNKCRGRQEVFCDDACSFCKRLNTCINELEMHRRGMECDVEAQANNCTKNCPSTWAPVCGSDQVMYSNKCLLELSVCESGKNVVVAHQGICKSQKEAEDVGQKKCDFSESCNIIDHVCGSDGQTYASECDLKQHNCIMGSKVKIVRNGVCPQQEDDNIGSPDDDEEYEGNKTEEQVDEDSRKLPELAIDSGSDLQDHDEKNKKCIKVCSKEMKPVCLNGVSNFSNRCVMEVAVCLKSLKVEQVTEGYCSDRKIPEEAADNKICKGFCTREYRPVCGSDDKTYPNQCNLEFAACMTPGLQKKSEGPCSDKGTPKVNEDNDKCFKACSKMMLPVCGTDGVTYSNLCLLEEAQCRDPTLELLPNGQCDETSSSKEPRKVDADSNRCFKACSKILLPVCGSDGVTYSNLCLFEEAQCREPTLEQLHKGQCDQTAPESPEKIGHEEPLQLTKSIFEIEHNDQLQLNVNRAFRMAMSCAIGVAVVSMLALFYILLKHQKSVRKSPRAMEFQNIGTFSDDPPSTVETDNSTGKNTQNKYSKLVFVD